MPTTSWDTTGERRPGAGRADDQDTAGAEQTGKKRATPPVMITVANRTETAARIRHAFERGSILIDELCDGDGILHIDSNVLKKAEEVEEPTAALPNQPEDDLDEDDAHTQENECHSEGGAPTPNGRHRRQGWAARRENPERDLGGHAVRRMGRKDGDPHHGTESLQQPTPLRAGGR